MSDADDAERATDLAARVTFGVLTALPHEHAAMKAMLDTPVSYRAPGRGAAHEYVLGEIPARSGGTHVVALVLGDQGNPNAAVHATTLVNDFPATNAVIMVGIAGGVPHVKKPELHVRLGDIVVSGEYGVVKYDFVKEHAVDRIVPRHPPRPPSPTLRAAARRLQSLAASGARPWEVHVVRAAPLEVVRPDASADLLADTSDPNSWLEHPKDALRRADQPRVFEGTIGAGDRLQKNPVRRDALRDQFDIRAIEMEGFGVAEATWVLEAGFFVVRGICDYCDSHKNDAWQPYAAVIAAAYARALLQETSAIPSGVSAARRPDDEQPLSDASDDHAPFASPPHRQVDRRGVGLRVDLHDADPALELEHQAHLDGARALLKKGHARLALDQLQAVKTRIWNAASVSVRSRVLALIGHTEFELGHFEAAGKALVAALAETPTDAKTQANAALGHTLLGNTTAALGWARKALDLDPTNIIARQILIQKDDRDDEAVLLEHEAVVGKRVEILFALGQRAGRAGDPSRAASWFRAATALDKTDPDIVAAAGQSLVDAIVERTDFRAYGWEEPIAADALTLREAAELLQYAWGQLRDDEVRHSRVHWLVSLGMARRILGERDATTAIAEDALKIGGRTPELVRFRAAVAADASDYAAVVQLLGGSGDNNPEALGLLAAAKSNLAQYDEAVALWTQLLALDLPDELRDQAERNYILTLLESGKPDESRAELTRLLGEAPTLPRHLLAIEAAGRLGDKALRDELLERAIALATRDASRRVLLSLGDTLMSASRPADAADIYGLCIDEPEGSDRDARRLITALYRAGRFDSALAACRRVVGANGTTRFCTEVESVILEELGALPAARTACERYLEHNPKDVGVLVRLGVILLRIGDADALSSLLTRISPADAAGDLELGRLYADLLGSAGRESEALDVLFQLRRRHIGDSSAHLLYIGRFTVLGRDLATPAVIGRDVAVRIAGADAPNDWTLIVSDSAGPSSPGEIPLSHPLAKALVGKRAGDAVTFDKAPHRRWTIEELSSKYVFAYRQSLSQFGTLFPEDGSLEQHAVSDDPGELVENIKERLVQGEPRWKEILNAYGAGNVTVGALGTALRRGPSESLGIVLASAHGLRASANTAEEKRLAGLLLEREDITLVADYSALSILNDLDVLDAAVAGRSVCVAQTTLDAFRQELARWKAMPDDGFMSLGLRDGQVLRHVLSAEDLVRLRGRIEALLDWIRQHCTVVPISPAVIEKHADKRELAPLLGHCFWDSLLLAAEPGRVLLSDDLRLRDIGRALFGADGVASVHLLVAQRAAGRIDAPKCATALVRLIVAGYKRVATDATMLEAAARLEAWRPVGAFQRVLDTLKGPDTELASAVVVAAEFFRLAWFGLVLPQQRDALYMAVLDALVAGRAAKDVLPIVRQALSARFRLLPAAASDIKKVLSLWSLMHLEP